MADVLGHRPLVLQFLIPPCRRCEQDDDLLKQHSFEYADLGVTVINVYGGRDQTAIQAYRNGGQFGVPDLTDPTGQLARRVGVGGRHQCCSSPPPAECSPACARLSILERSCVKSEHL